MQLNFAETETAPIAKKRDEMETKMEGARGDRTVKRTEPNGGTATNPFGGDEAGDNVAPPPPPSEAGAFAACV